MIYSGRKIVFIPGDAVRVTQPAAALAYLLRDEFTDTLDAGSVNGTAATPGPGTRTVVDTGNKLSVGGGNLIISGYTANNDPGIRYESMARTPGRLLIFHVNKDNLNNRQQFGFTNAATGDLAGPNIYTTDVVNAGDTGLSTAVAGGLAISTSYYLAVVLRANGGYMFMKVGTTWKLLFMHRTSADLTVYPTSKIRTGWGGGNDNSDFIRVPDTLWYPGITGDAISAPLAYDTFDRADGALGSTETTGPDGQTVTARAWTDEAGTWGISTNKAACSALSVGGLGIASVNATSINVHHKAQVTRTAGNAGVFVRYADADNYVYAIHNGTNAQLYKRVGGVETLLVNAAATYGAGRELVIDADGTAFRMYYFNALIGTQQAISDAGLQTGTKCGLYTSDTGNSFDVLLTMPKGTGGEYASLDNY